MNKDKKQLLLKDLCARLPYGVKFNFGNNNGCDYKVEIVSPGAINNSFPIEDCKPYLRPMSSMTEEEKDEYFNSYDWEYFEEGTPFDWLNEHHFDYHGLIEKGLALEALEGMYKTE